MSSKVKLYTRFDPPPSPVLECKSASLTRQEFAAEADINNIMQRYAAGMPLPSGDRQPIFDDFSDVPDLASAYEILERAKSQFALLPSRTRERFGNDPQQLLAFLQDPGNRDEAVSLGLIDPPKSEVSKSVSVPAKGGSDEPPPTTTT